MAPLTPKQAMLMAIEEGKKGAGFVSPNPLVGCVIVDRNHRLLSTGYHARLGEAHAEAAALKKIADQQTLTGAHVYVTLEPCAHEGRTPSCAKALAALPIASITYGLLDPNPLVAGKGVEILRQAGKKIEVFTDLQDELEELAEIFLTNVRERRPFVALKVAASVDGRIALPDGSSQWLTGEAARENVHYLRGCYDALITGVGTVMRDDPRLNSRLPQFTAKAQKLIILDPEGQSLAHLERLHLTKVRRAEDLFVVLKAGLKHKSTLAQCIEFPLSEEGFDLRLLLQTLQGLGLHSFLVEAGGFTSGKFLQAGIVDRLYLYLAAKILGAGLSWTEGLHLLSLEQALPIKKMRVQTFAEDLLLTGRLGE